MENEARAEPEKETQVDPEKLLNMIVIVSTKGGRRFRGKLTQYDAHMNLVLEEVEEFPGKEPVAKHRLVLIKGGNISSISI
jgi:small nuclear ribonucleoprotein (snRNP)-like protein